jgi:hypothetical protein
MRLVLVNGYRVYLIMRYYKDFVFNLVIFFNLLVTTMFIAFAMKYYYSK